LHDYRNTDFDDSKSQDWLTLALILGENGWTRDALELTEQVVQLDKTKLGEDHPDTLHSMHNLAIYYNEAGRRSEALQLTEQVMQLRKTSWRRTILTLCTRWSCWHTLLREIVETRKD
jgi:hypothetical protein